MPPLGLFFAAFIGEASSSLAVPLNEPSWPISTIDGPNTPDTRLLERRHFYGGAQSRRRKWR
jgi:hypothetical protein